MTRHVCCLSPNCGLSAENKKDNNFTRLVECRICLKSWHAFCVGYQTMEETEFSEKSATFACNKCNYFVNAVADVVTEKLSVIINNLQAKLEEKILSRPLSPLRNENNDIMTDVIKPVVKEIIHSPLTEASTECSTVNATAAVAETRDKKSNVQPTENLHGKLFLCSVEKSLTLNDIRLILEDAEIDVNHISFCENIGNFKSKKFITVEAEQNVQLFKFKLAFNKSGLNGTWFLRASPPRNPIKLQSNNNTNLEYHDITKQHENAHSFQSKSKPFQSKPVSFHSKPFNRQTQKFNVAHDRTQNSYSQHRNFNKNSNFSRPKPSYSAALNNRTNQSTYTHNNAADDQYISKQDFQSFLGEALNQILHR